MDERWQYQLRVNLADDPVEVARGDCNEPALRFLRDIMDKHHATLVNQFDAFTSDVVEASLRHRARHGSPPPRRGPGSEVNPTALRPSPAGQRPPGVNGR
jgi:hypothetical protein